MKLFEKLIKTKFDKIQELSNLKEKQYLQIISELRAEYEKQKTREQKLKDYIEKLKKQNGKNNFYS